MIAKAVNYEACKAELKACVERVRAAEVSTPYLECGPQTYAVLAMMAIARVPITEADYARRQIDAGKLELTFCNVRIINCPDVPEHRLWPPRAVSATASSRRLGQDMEVADDATGFQQA